MTDIFSNQPGSVVAVPTRYAAPVLFGLTGWGGAPTMNAIITGFSTQELVSAQFQHTLDKFIYVYVFGDRIGEFQIQGLTFPRFCHNGLTVHGFEAVEAYYDELALSTTGAPLSVVVGIETAFTCYLTAIGQQLLDADTGVGRFAMKLALLP